MTDAKTSAPPRAAQRPTVTERHGDRLEDPYAWLKDENWQQVMREPDVLDGEIRAYLEAENDYTDGDPGAGRALKERLFEEIKGRIKEDDSSVPAPDGAYEYYRRYETGGQHPLFCRRARDGTARRRRFSCTAIGRPKAMPISMSPRAAKARITAGSPMRPI